MARYTLDFTTADGVNPIKSGDKHGNIARLRVALRKFAMGGYPAGTNSIAARHTAAAATATITLSTCTADTVLEINGVRFIARASGTALVANNEFTISGTDAADATALAAAVNACTDARISGVVTASSTGSSGVVTLTSSLAGYAGNAITVKSLGVLAKAIITCASVADADTVTLNGVVLTAETGSIDANEWAPGASDATCATNLAALINSSASALIANHLFATADGATVTVWAKAPGDLGNANTIATSNGTRLAITGGLARLGSGVVTQGEGARASGTVTISGADGGNYTVLVNGVTTGNVAGTNGDDTATAASIAAAINGLTNALVGNQVLATASLGVVTVTAIRGGVSGNAITLSATGTGATASGARLTGGAAPTTAVASSERLASGADTLVSMSF